MTILHIFDDDKFIDRHIGNVRAGNFENTFIYLKYNYTYKGTFGSKIEHVIPYSERYYELIRECTGYQIVILYYLSRDKAKIVELIHNKGPWIIWSFYGADLYNLPLFRRELLSKGTKNLLKYRTLRDFILSYFPSFYDYVSGWRGLERSILDIVCKIDYFAWYCESEYEYIKSKIGSGFPLFLESSVSSHFRDIEIRLDKSDSLLLGNSASRFNNHVDIITILEGVRYSGSVVIPLSYPKDDNYKRGIMDIARSSDLKIQILDEFMTFNEYVDLISRQKIAVFNSYRQMGLGNIFISLRCGVKVYLNERNPCYEWLLGLGFRVFSIQRNLREDLARNDFDMPTTDMENNVRVLLELVKEDANRRFMDMLRLIGSSPRNCEVPG